MHFYRKCLVITMTSILGFMIFGGSHKAAAQEAPIILTVKAAPNAAYATQQPMRSDMLKAVLRSVPQEPAAVKPVTDMYLTLSDKGIRTTYPVDRFGRLYDEGKSTFLVLDAKSKKNLLAQMDQLRAQHYGRMIPWSTVKSEIPRKTKFKVIDLESGLSFHVQRRAGSHHADVQPLTKADTAIMKKIYNGTWSWGRKAIIVESDAGRYAASMAGMPHGGDGIPGNGFSGHFCIHFLGSSTHGTGHIDPEHQLMVYKAGGLLDRYFDQAVPEDIVNAFMIGVNQKDIQLLHRSLSNADPRQAELVNRMLEQLSGVRHKWDKGKRQTPSGLLTAELPVEVQLLRKNRSIEQAKWNFHFRRLSILDPWYVESVEMNANQKQNQKQKQKISKIR